MFEKMSINLIDKFFVVALSATEKQTNKQTKTFLLTIYELLASKVNSLHLFYVFLLFVN